MHETAEMFEDRLRGSRQRHGRNIGVAEREDARAKIKVAIVVRASEAEFREGGSGTTFLGFFEIDEGIANSKGIILIDLRHLP